MLEANCSKALASIGGFAIPLLTSLKYRSSGLSLSNPTAPTILIAKSVTVIADSMEFTFVIDTSGSSAFLSFGKSSHSSAHENSVRLAVNSTDSIRATCSLT